MSVRAWCSIIGVMASAVLASALLALHFTPSATAWMTLGMLSVLATLAQLFRAEAPNHVDFYATPVFLFAGVFLVPPPFLILLVTVPHLVDWGKERLAGSGKFRAWYLQPFNIAMYTLSGLVAQGVGSAISTHSTLTTGPFPVPMVVGAALTYVAVNHFILGSILVMARQVSWRDSGMFNGESLLTEFVLACLGGVIATLWISNPWLIPLALTPLVLMYRALLIPQLKREAQTDAKTGLANARHFAELFREELDRAKRFDRPLAVIMADLDRFKVINDTYGHLAGDVVLTTVAAVIRATIRDYDIAGRFGGEEFALVLPEMEPDQARDFAERLRLAIAETKIAVGGQPLPLSVTMSLGVACFPSNGETPSLLTGAADAAVYVAKAGGRNRVTMASQVTTAPITTGATGMEQPLTLPLATVEPDQPVAAVAWRGWSPGRQAVVEQENGKRDENSQAVPAMATTRAPLWLFVSGVILAGIGATLVGVVKQPVPPASVVALLAFLGASAEVLQLELYVGGTISVSVTVIFASALLSGLPGVALVSAAVALSHHFRQGRSMAQMYRTTFNWATHVLAGLMPVLAVQAWGGPVGVRTVLTLALPAACAATAYYLVETGLIATAISLEDGKRFISTWRSQYQWLAGHYLALCLIGLVLSIAYDELSTLGIVVFALPAFMMHFAQRQYMQQTRQNVRELKRINQELTRAALTDYVTGLGNQRAFQEGVIRAVDRATKEGEPVALARLDVDELKMINDQQGHDEGDRVLIDLAAILRSTGARDWAYRVGGDEFALLLPHTTLARANILLEEVRRDIERRLHPVTVSIGVAASIPGDHDADLLHDQALAALHEVKRRGRNAVITFDAIAADVAVTSSAQAQAVRRLIADRGINIAFQPIWDLGQDRLLAVEALARPGLEYGLQGPQQAFDIAEQMGRAHDLDAVCRSAILKRAADLPPDTLLFLNVSPQTLDHDLLSGLALVDAVQAVGLVPSQVVLELTERSMTRLSVVVREAKRLRDLGFKLALDDTGAGNAGLEMLSQLPVDYVKIDRSVVTKAMADNSARAVLAGILAIARQTRTYVIAEGIETAAMLRLVREMGGVTAGGQEGVQGVQGYLLGRPEGTMPAALALPWSLTA